MTLSTLSLDPFTRDEAWATIRRENELRPFAIKYRSLVNLGLGQLDELYDGTNRNWDLLLELRGIIRRPYVVDHPSLGKGCWSRVVEATDASLRCLDSKVDELLSRKAEEGNQAVDQKEYHQAARIIGYVNGTHQEFPNVGEGREDFRRLEDRFCAEIDREAARVAVEVEKGDISKGVEFLDGWSNYFGASEYMMRELVPLLPKMRVLSEKVEGVLALYETKEKLRRE